PSCYIMDTGKKTDPSASVQRANPDRSLATTIYVPEQGGYKERFLKPVEMKYKCEKCRLVLCNPRQTECGHRFCETCMNAVLSSSNSQCMACEDIITKDKVFKDNCCRREVLALQMYCRNENRGCKELITLGNLLIHLKSDCQFEELSCPRADCKEKVIRKDLSDHIEKTCKYRETLCKFCRNQVSLVEMQKHEEVDCPSVVISCPHMCSVKSLLRSENVNRRQDGTWRASFAKVARSFLVKQLWATKWSECHATVDLDSSREKKTETPPGNMQRSRLDSGRRSAESNVAVPGDRTKKAAKGKALKVALEESFLSAGETETGAGSHPEKDPNAGAAVGSRSNSAEETNAEMTEVSGKAPRDFESAGRMEEAASTIAHRVAESALQEPRSHLISETSITDTRQGVSESAKNVTGAAACERGEWSSETNANERQTMDTDLRSVSLKEKGGNISGTFVASTNLDNSGHAGKDNESTGGSNVIEYDKIQAHFRGCCRLRQQPQCRPSSCSALLTSSVRAETKQNVLTKGIDVLIKDIRLLKGAKRTKAIRELTYLNKEMEDVEIQIKTVLDIIEPWMELYANKKRFEEIKRGGGDVAAERLFKISELLKENANENVSPPKQKSSDDNDLPLIVFDDPIEQVVTDPMPEMNVNMQPNNMPNVQSENVEGNSDGGENNANVSVKPMRGVRKNCLGMFRLVGRKSRMIMVKGTNQQIKAHEASSAVQHVNLMKEWSNYLETKVSMLQNESSEKNKSIQLLHNQMCSFEIEIERHKEQLRNNETRIIQLQRVIEGQADKLKDLDKEIRNLRQTGDEADGMKSNYESLQNRLSQLEIMAKNAASWNPGVLETQINRHDQMLSVHDIRLADMDLRFQVLETASYNGVLIWKIRDYKRRKQEAVMGKTLSLYSQPFYTGYFGYKMCARVYLNGDGMGKGTHLSLFFVIMRGEYDALLPWPFKQKVSLMLMDQGPSRRHLGDAFKPDPNSSSFKKPTGEMNIASGCPVFVAQTVLENGTYIKDDTIFIKVIVDTSDLPDP
ncbi:hypothetical protein XELAEV_18041180mg, partial [Xenopus laevis]